MKLGRRTDGTTVLVIEGDSLVIDVVDAARDSGADLLGALLGEDGRGPWDRLIDRWEEAVPMLAAIESAARSTGDGVPIGEVELGVPLSSPGVRIFAVGANFAPHAARSEHAMSEGAVDVEARTQELRENKQRGVPPWGFNVIPSTVVGSDQLICPPPVASKLDYEGEVAAILRSDGCGGVQIWGVAPWNDFSLRDPHFGMGPRIDEGPLTWSLQKNFDTGSSCGPWVLVDPAIDPDRITFRLRVNGELRQEGSTADMIYGFDDVIEHVGRFVSLRSGDIVASGTPSGTAFESGVDGPFLAAGDRVEVEVDGVGTLRNEIAARTADQET